MLFWTLEIEYFLNIFFLWINIIILLFIVFSFNPIFSISYLILFFFFNFVILIILKVEFMSILFLVIYAGAISILFLFVILLFDLKFLLSYTYNNFFTNIYNNLLCVFFLVFFQFLFFLFFDWYWVSFSIFTKVNVHVDWLSIFYYQNELEVIGLVLFSYFPHYVILLGFILFIATIGIIILGMNKNVIIIEKNFYKMNDMDFKSLFFFNKNI